MIAAIRELAKEPNQESAKPVADFLDACNLIFEKGLLSKRRINNMNSPAIQNVKKGMAFFEKWCQSHEETGISSTHNIKAIFHLSFEKEKATALPMIFVLLYSL